VRIIAAEEIGEMKTGANRSASASRAVFSLLHRAVFLRFAA